ncbi:pyridoxamine 5'-phosphate oxidase family protein [Streptomyces collinus]
MSSSVSTGILPRPRDWRPGPVVPDYRIPLSGFPTWWDVLPPPAASCRLCGALDRGAAVLVGAINGVVVAFEADEFDAATRSGWSVVVTGRATVVTDPAEHERLSRDGPTSWMPLAGAAFVRIESQMVTGRELRPPGL